MHATRAAVEEGIVAGGGVALIRCIAVLDKLKLTEEESHRRETSSSARSRNPCGQIALNAGHEGAVIVKPCSRKQEDNFGFNAETGEFGDMVRCGRNRPGQGHAPRAPKTPHRLPA